MSTSIAPTASLDSKPITNGWDAQANKPIIVGHAPLAPRPGWLPWSGPGQKNVEPLKWSLSVEQWIRFVGVCVTTETWKKLAKEKGEYGITMYDVNEHFVKPWTQGTGCSIALLMNADQQLPAEGMFSHAWAGSVIETYNCLQNMVNHSGVPSTTRFYFCTFSNYQHDDGAFGAPTLDEQVGMNPFMKVIESKPKYGIFVLHTSMYEVYERLWVAHEADVGQACNVQMRGLFDMYRWTIRRFEQATPVKTSEGKCGNTRDRAYIDGLVQERGGYERLDRVIVDFRAVMLRDLKALLDKVDKKEHQGGQGCYGKHTSNETKMDWKSEESGTENLMRLSGSDYGSGSVGWRFEHAWTSAIYGHMHPEELDEFNKLDVQMERLEQLTTESEASATLEAAEAFHKRMQRRETAWPLGAASYPLGESRSWSWGDGMTFSTTPFTLYPSWEARRAQRASDDYMRWQEARKAEAAAEAKAKAEREAQRQRKAEAKREAERAEAARLEAILGAGRRALEVAARLEVARREAKPVKVKLTEAQKRRNAAEAAMAAAAGAGPGNAPKKKKSPSVVIRTLLKLNRDVSLEDVDTAGAARLAAELAMNVSVTRLDLRGSKVGYLGAAALAAALETNRTLLKLNLTNNSVGDMGARSLSTALEKNLTLQTLNLRANKLSEVGRASVKAIAERLAHNRQEAAAKATARRAAKADLEAGRRAMKAAQREAAASSSERKRSSLAARVGRLMPGRAEVSLEAAPLAAELATNTSVTWLIPGMMGDAGAAALAAALEMNETLQKLNLEHCSVGNAGAAVLALVLETNKTLRMLKIGNNPLNAAGAAALAAALETNETLQELDLRDCKVGNTGAAALAAALKTNRTLQTLKLVDCGLDDADADVLAKALQTNETLQELDLLFNDFEDELAVDRAIKAKLAHNRQQEQSPPPRWW